MTTQLQAVHDPADDVTRLIDLQARIKQMNDEADTIKARLRELGDGTWEIGNSKVTISPNRRFDVKTAQQVIPAPLLPLCMEQVVTSKRAKASLPPAIYSACMVEVGDPRVTVR